MISENKSHKNRLKRLDNSNTRSKVRHNVSKARLNRVINTKSQFSLNQKDLELKDLEYYDDYIESFKKEIAALQSLITAASSSKALPDTIKKVLLKKAEEAKNFFSSVATQNVNHEAILQLSTERQTLWEQDLEALSQLSKELKLAQKSLIKISGLVQNLLAN